MTTYVVLAVLLVVVGLVIISVLLDWRRSGRAFCTPLPRPYRDRGSHEAVWRDRCGEKFGEADAVLAAFCEAFRFNPDDRYKFGPDDQVMAIYRARYPGWRVGDEMEIESLMMDLDKQYGIDVLDWHSDITLGDLVELASEKRGD